jgi:uncharacterized membrane protein YhaH (DUF805 family)
LRTIRGIGDYSGRSRRAEVVFFLIAYTLLAVVLSFAVLSFTSYAIARWFGIFLRLLFFVPFIPLFVRRLHDQDLSGWLAALLPVAFLLALPHELAASTGNVQALFAEKGSGLQLLFDAVCIVILILCFLPGSRGPNRFGPDPRLEDA